MAPSGPRTLLSNLAPDVESFVGRDAALRVLDEAWDRGRVRVVSVVGLGGSGKSQLVTHWLKRAGERRDRAADPVLAWSFRSTGWPAEPTSADREGPRLRFLETALAWFGDLAPTLGSVVERAERLVRRIRASRTLLVLDGLDVWQHPPGTRTGRLLHPALRVLVRELAAWNPGLCILTSRLRIGEIASFKGTSVVELDLPRLSKAAGSDLLARLGVRGSDAARESAAEELHGHASALTSLADALHRSVGGDVEQRHRLPDFAPRDPSDEVVREYQSCFQGRVELSMLRLLGLCPGSAGRDELETLLGDPTVAELTPELRHEPAVPTGVSLLNARPWRRAAARLREAKLVAPRSRLRPDALEPHAIVRRHFAREVRERFPEAWAAGRRLLAERSDRPN